MAKLSFTSKCPCGTEVKGKVKKPTWFENSFAKVNCQKCGTRFMLSCVRDKSTRDRVFTTHIDLLELSDEAHQIQSSKLSIKVKILKEKIIGPSKTDASDILHYMDENEQGG